jgi:hypothetical protein
MADNLAVVPHLVKFRQTWNRTTNGWSCPKRWDNKNPKWRVIVPQHRNRIIHYSKGYLHALWRVRDEMLKVMDAFGKPVWNCTRIDKVHKTYPTSKLGVPVTYTIFFFNCTRHRYDMSGGMR